MADREEPRYIALTPVKTERRADFESFIREVIVPAVEKARPDLAGRWQVLRPAETAAGGDENYALLFYGDATLEEWDLGTLLTAAYGEDDGHARLDEFQDFLSGEQLVGAFAGSAFQRA
jgi:hypothetical protein